MNRRNTRKSKTTEAARPIGRFRHRDYAILTLIISVVFIIYSPALNGGRLWDDDAHLTKPELQSTQGLQRIWFQVGATQQYYPLLFTVFWIEHQIWGESVLGYHLANVVLHSAAVVLVYLNLTKLQARGALLAAAIFAVHPVMVESVAWMSEQKNTLSACFFLGSMLLYFHFDKSRNRAVYCLSFGLFALGLLTKTIIATLPGPVLFIIWWRRGTLSVRNDVLPLFPFFGLGAAFGLFTAILERKLVGAVGPDFALSIAQRLLIAGRVIWFYLGKLAWPQNLSFIYPRWNVNAAVWWQWLFPLAAVGTTFGLWLLRRWSRAPFAAWLYFCGTLFPALGFLNVYPFIFSFVADHFQYLASLGPITLFAATIVTAVSRVPERAKWLLPLAGSGLILMLSVATREQVGFYKDSETLYRATLDRNPSCWLCELNLGTICSNSGRVDEALQHFRRSVEFNPQWSETHSNLGISLCNRGDLKEGLEHLRVAVELMPNSALARLDYANGLVLTGRFPDAVSECSEAVRLQPESAFGRFSFAIALYRAGRMEQARLQCEYAIQLDPNNERARSLLKSIVARQSPK